MPLGNEVAEPKDYDYVSSTTAILKYIKNILSKFPNEFCSLNVVAPNRIKQIIAERLKTDGQVVA